MPKIDGAENGVLTEWNGLVEGLFFDMNGTERKSRELNAGAVSPCFSEPCATKKAHLQFLANGPNAENRT